MKSLQVGPGMLETAQINPVVSRAHCDKVAAHLEEARQQKAEAHQRQRRTRCGVLYSADAGGKPRRRTAPHP